MNVLHFLGIATSPSEPAFSKEAIGKIQDFKALATLINRLFVEENKKINSNNYTDSNLPKDACAPLCERFVQVFGQDARFKWVVELFKTTVKFEAECGFLHSVQNISKVQKGFVQNLASMAHGSEFETLCRVSAS